MTRDFAGILALRDWESEEEGRGPADVPSYRVRDGGIRRMLGTKSKKGHGSGRERA